MPRDINNNIVSRVARVETDIQNIGSAVKDLTQAVDTLADKVSVQSKTDWGVLGSWSAVLVLVISSIGYLSTQPIVNGLLEIRSEFKDHEKLGYHPHAEAVADALKEDYVRSREDLKKQDTALQREMRDLDKAIKDEITAKIEALDRMVQREMRLLDQTQDETIKALGKRIEEIVEEQKSRTSRVYKLHK